MITPELKQEVLNYLQVSPKREAEYAKCDDSFFLFYARCAEAGLHFSDADRYAILNTLLGYDIGKEKARQIDGWCYEHDEEIYELDANPESKALLEQASKELGLELDFSGWATEPISEYKFFDKAD